MILTDYFRSKKDSAWDIAKQCGVSHGVIRLPEEESFDLTDVSHWQTVYERFTDFGIKPLVIEPMPNCVHDHIKVGDALRDESVEKVIKMFPIMRDFGIGTICFNWMAYIGWCRTSNDITERGGAKVTGFDLNDFQERTKKITADELWKNYEYFIKAVIPYAEKYDVKLALHPDDPPVERLGNTERIMINFKNIRRAVATVSSDHLGVTFCQATYHMMGEDVYNISEELKDKIFFIHFRNATGNKYHFRETFHDNGDIEMGKLLRHYHNLGVNVPIRVDHVPTLLGEDSKTAGYDALGRLFAIGYLKGLLENINV